VQLRIATCSFPVSAVPAANERWVTRQMSRARQRGAQVAHFPECALSGYVGADFDSLDGYDWDALRASTQRVLEHAAELGMWIVLGSTHPLTAPHKPHNCAYVIDSGGQLAGRYDKRFCAGADGSSGELAHYTPGDHFTMFDVGGVRCGVLICHDYRYPELYRGYQRLGVQVVFHSFYAGRVTAQDLRAALRELGQPEDADGRASLPGVTMPTAMITAASTNHVWISASNTSARESCWPSFVVRPDGLPAGRLRLNTAGVLLTTIDTESELYDSTAAWRGRAMDGVLHSGQTVTDPRSADVTTL
jgi:predicted amidohydrolase